MTSQQGETKSVLKGIFALVKFKDAKLDEVFLSEAEECKKTKSLKILKKLLC